MMNKAFTLIELLVVIFIIGMILTLAIPSVMNVVVGNSKEAYNIHMKVVENATKLYTLHNKGVMGLDSEGKCYNLSYSRLKESQDIKESEITCDGNIYIYKTKKDYEYKYNLTCVDKRGRECSKKTEEDNSCTVEK